jgi:hypothetical protein
MEESMMTDRILYVKEGIINHRRSAALEIGILKRKKEGREEGDRRQAGERQTSAPSYR